MFFYGEFIDQNIADLMMRRIKKQTDGNFRIFIMLIESKNGRSGNHNYSSNKRTEIEEIPSSRTKNDLLLLEK